MKRLLVAFAAALMLVCMLAGCTKSAEILDVTDMPTRLEEKVADETDAVLDGPAAREFIKTQYTAEELGITDYEDSVDFAYRESTYEFDGEKYIVVEAISVTLNTDVTTEDGKETYSSTTVGQYLVSLDGKTVIKKDMATGEYSKLKSRITDYSAKGDTTTE
ncbi:MAG: hypothetical protein J5964_01050 [Eubacterium sp.]|nr:hypothetical protein [Eubacterium sp.]